MRGEDLTQGNVNQHFTQAIVNEHLTQANVNEPLTRSIRMDLVAEGSLEESKRLLQMRLACREREFFIDKLLV